MVKSIINFEPEYDELLSKADNVSVEQPDDAFCKFYYLYEYTDEIEVILDSHLYPSMINYVKTGIMTREEMIEALTN